jgi:CobQ-like glutamine amidotransferase family enzyme
VKPPVRIVRILPELLRLNGSLGNAEVLQARLNWWGVEAQFHDVHAGENLPGYADIVVLGSGTSSALATAAAELTRWRDGSHRITEQGGLWCGFGLGGDLLGHTVSSSTGETHQGLGLTPVVARLGGPRFSGEVSGRDPQGRVVAGYLNDHTTREGSGVSPLISLDIHEKTPWSGYTAVNEEGTLFEGVYQDGLWVSALSGPLLALNPGLADDILHSWASRQDTTLPEPTAAHQLADSRAEKARQAILDRR